MVEHSGFGGNRFALRIAFVVRRVMTRNFPAQIVRGEIATGTYMGSISIRAGILSAAGMTN